MSNVVSNANPPLAPKESGSKYLLEAATLMRQGECSHSWNRRSEFVSGIVGKGFQQYMRRLNIPDPSRFDGSFYLHYLAF